MSEGVRERLFEIAKRALKATEAGQLRWTRTSEAPPEYYAHLTDKTGLAIRRIAGERARFTSVDAALRALRATAGLEDPLEDQLKRYQPVKYLLALTTPGRGEIASLTSLKYSEPSEEYRTLASLFEAAQFDGDAVGETLDEALSALPTVP